MDAIKTFLKQKTSTGYINIQPIITPSFSHMDMMEKQYELKGDPYSTIELLFCAQNELQLLFPGKMTAGIEHTLILSPVGTLKVVLPKYIDKFLAYSESANYELKGISIIKFMALPLIDTEHFQRVFFWTYNNMIKIL